MPSVYDIVEILPLEDGVPKQTATELGLIADNKALQARVQELEGEVNRLVSLDAQNRDNYERCHKALVEKQLCLAQLEWRSVDVKPTREDGNYNGIVCIADGEGNMSTLAYNLWHMLDAKWQWWRPAALPVVKDEERERFNAWYDARCADPSQHKTQLREAMYDAWRAARKEGGV